MTTMSLRGARRLVPAITMATIAAIWVVPTASGRPSTTASASAAATRRATLATFAGYWGGHTRYLKITPGGSAKESIGDGCCHPLVDLRLELSHPRGTVHVASVAIRVTSVKVHDRNAYKGSYDPPFPGQVSRMRLRYGVLTDPITRATYCNEAQDRKGTCGL